MTREDIIRKVTEETELNPVNVRKIVPKIFDMINNALIHDEHVELRGFGVFKIKSKKRRIGRNPRTGQPIDVAPKKVVIFKPGLKMKQQINDVSLA